MSNASWVIVEKTTNKAIFETFSEKTAKSINADKYKAIPILQYLQDFNRGLKNV